MKTFAIRHINRHDRERSLRGGAGMNVLTDEINREKYGFSNSIIDLDIVVFDHDFIEQKLINEYHREINERRRNRTGGLRSLKCVSILKIVFGKVINESSDEMSDVPVFFPSNANRLIQGNVRALVSRIVHEFDNNILDFTVNGSGLTLKSCENIQNKYFSYRDAIAGAAKLHFPREGFRELPKCFYTYKRVLKINYMDSVFVENEIDNKCFLHILQYHELRKRLTQKELTQRESRENRHDSELSNYHYVSINEIALIDITQIYDLSVVKTPMRLVDLHEFQQQNQNIRLNCFELDRKNACVPDEAIEFQHRNFSLIPYYISDNVNECDTINILYCAISSHFYYCLNLQSLVKLLSDPNAITPSTHDRLCVNCLVFIDIRIEKLLAHFYNCIKNKTQRRVMPNPKSFVKFNRYNLTVKNEIFIVGDIETSQIPIEPPAFNLINVTGLPVKMSTKLNAKVYKQACDETGFPFSYSETSKPVGLHRVNSIGYHFHCSKEFKNFPHDKIIDIGGKSGTIYAMDDSSSSEEKIIQQFMTWCDNVGKIVRNYMFECNDPSLQRSQIKSLLDDITIYRNFHTTMFCFLCKQDFVNSNCISEKKILHHHHLTGEYIGM